MSEYEPAEYWQRRGRCYCGRPIPREIEALAGWARAPSIRDILEIGPGWGRIYVSLGHRGILEGKTFRMVDFVESMRDHCERATGIRPDLWDGVRLPYADRQFDLVILFSVLLHVPPADIDRVWAEAVRVSRRWVYVATMGPAVGGPLATHCFHHDYDRILEHGARLLERYAFDDARRMHYILQVADRGNGHED